MIYTPGRNLILNSANLVLDRLDQPEGSRREYGYFNLGQSYKDVPDNTVVTLSFDVTFQRNSASTYQLSVYNSNNKGPKTFAASIIYFSDVQVGSSVTKRVHIPIVITDRPSAEVTDQNNNYIEFYSVYGTNNWYKISNLMMCYGTVEEHGSVVTTWRPAPEDLDYEGGGWIG